MNTSFRKITCAAVIAVTVAFGCHKDSPTPTTSTTTPTPTSEGYTSMSDFYTKNGVAVQTYTITGSAGGSFTSPQGTVVTIPANAFLNSSSQVVTGTVTIQFKDIYKKSDMLLSNIATTTNTGAPLKSGGEFFIKPTSGGNALTLANSITVKQPLDSLPPDSAMTVYYRDTTGWALANLNATIAANASGYLSILYTLSTPATTGTWCNSDDPSFFSAYTQGTLILQEIDNPSDYGTNVYLVFKGINTTDVCHTEAGSDFNFTNCVPVGLQCTAVALGVKNGTLYSAIIPITITSNQTVSFSMTATTTAAFKTALAALN